MHIRKTEDIYRIMWSSQYGLEKVDSFPRGGVNWKANREYANKMVAEYNLAYGEGHVYKRNGREKLEQAA